MTLNEAIFRVITTQFKKDMDGADKVVEGAGYIVCKNDGRFIVETPRENARIREIEFRESYRGYRLVAWNGYRQKEYRYETIEDLKKFDFTGFLNKPINYTYAEVVDTQTYSYMGNTVTQKKIRRLTDAKYYIRYRKDAINRIKKEIAKLQGDLEAGIREQVRYEENLRNVRKDLGLIK